MEHTKSHLPLTESPLSRKLGDALLSGVITAAALSEKPRPGIWRDMLRAADRGAAGTKEGTVDAFLFQAMVDRLLEEFHMGEK